MVCVYSSVPGIGDGCLSTIFSMHIVTVHVKLQYHKLAW